MRASNRTLYVQESIIVFTLLQILNFLDLSKLFKTYHQKCHHITSNETDMPENTDYKNLFYEIKHLKILRP